MMGEWSVVMWEMLRAEIDFGLTRDFRCGGVRFPENGV